MSEKVSPIRSELLAAKIEKLLNFDLPDLFDEFSEEPRFIRALWFLEFVSKPDNYPGGLTKFVGDFVDSCAEQIGTPTMVKCGQAIRYEPQEAIEVFKEMRSCYRQEIFGDETWLYRNAFLHNESSSHRLTLERVVSSWDLGEDEDKLETWTGTRGELHRLLVAKLTPQAVRELYSRDARESLPEYFKQLCELPHVGFQPNENGSGAPTDFPRVGPALLSFIDQRSSALQSRIAETEITRLISRWMTKARTMNEPVMISGNSRFGKTEAVKLHCEMNPGAYRLVNTPATNAIGDLLREVAKSLGIEVAAQNSVRELRERIDYVLRFSKLICVFDEAQFLFPAVYSTNTAPARLNWVRRAIMDQGLAAIFVCTPQSYETTKRRFAKKTGFAMEQFDERVLKTVKLPDEICEADLLAVARIHFSESQEDYLQMVVQAALATERNYLSDVRKIAILSKDNARENGRQRPLLCDIEAAIADVLPALPSPTVTPTRNERKTPVASPLPKRCNVPALPPQPLRISPSTLPQSRRGMTPLAVKT